MKYSCARHGLRVCILDNDNMPSQEKKERGCFLSCVLVLSLLAALFNVFFSGSYLVVNAPERFSEMEYWLYFVFFAVSICAIYCVILTFKMRKKGAAGLLVAMAITIAFLLLGALYEKPTGDAAEAGAGWMLIMAVGCFVCAVVVALHLKKME